MELRICTDCECTIEEGSERWVDGRCICSDCTDNYQWCEDCQSYTEDVVSINNEQKYVCLECSESYSICDECSGIYCSYNLTECSDGEERCHDCLEDYIECWDCEDVIHIDNSYYNENDDRYYCSGCYQPSSGNLFNHDYTPELTFYGDGKLYAGVELEIDQGEKRTFLNSMIDEVKEVYFKRDGSLSEDGVEIVSHPCSFNYHRQNLNWEKICNVAKECGFTSHNNGDCGLHVHVNRTFFGDSVVEQELHIAKLILVVVKHWEKITILSRRGREELDNWACKPMIDRLAPDDNQDIIVAKTVSSRYADKGRYQAINIQNRNTVEFRFFRGTLKLESFQASLDFVECITRRVKEISLSDVLCLEWSDIFSNDVLKDYPMLYKYLSERGI